VASTCAAKRWIESAVLLLLLACAVEFAAPAPTFADGRCASQFEGTDLADTLVGTPGGDRVVGKGGEDVLRGLAAADCLKGGPSADTAAGGRGSDRIAGGGGGDVLRARDGSRDIVRCGSGRDVAVVDMIDVVRRCEDVTDSGSDDPGSGGSDPGPGPGSPNGYVPSTYLGTVPAGAHYLSPDGSDTNPGTESQPWRTLAKAVASVSPGHTVVLLPGTYGARGTTNMMSRGGTAQAPVTFRGQPGAELPRILGLVKITSSHQRFNHLLFDGPTGMVKPPTSDNPDGEQVQISILGPAVSGIEISDSEIRDSGWHAGIYLDTAEDVRITGNYIHDNGDFFDPVQENTSHGIYFSAGSGLIANNVIEHNVARGVQLYEGPHDVVIANNTVVGNGKAGIQFGNETTRSIAVNNVVAYNGSYGIRSAALTGTSNVVKRNLVWQNGSWNLSPSDGLTLIDNLTLNPGFGPSDDFRATTASPLVDRALGGYAPPMDFDGEARPQGAAPDLGAFESG
jgi:Right handed beta helix region/Protein of unknown function (DUF1565)/RTX calcium-binding nonapeptide repeat (4 copies)